MGKGRGEGKKEIEMGIGEMQIRIDPYDGAMKIGVELGRTKEPRSFSYGIIKEIGKERKDIYEKEIKENEEEIIISDIEGNEERYKIETGDEEKEYPYQCKKEGKRLKKKEEKYEIKDSQGNRYQYGRNGRLLQYEGKNSETLQYQSESEGYRYENEKYQIRCQENSEGNLIRVEVKEGERELERYELQYFRKELYRYRKYIGEEKIEEIVIQQAYDREKGAMRYHILDPIHHQWIRCYRREEKIIEIDEGNQEEGSRGNPIHIHYEGQQRRIKDEEGNEILQGYDEEGRIVYAIDQKGRSERYQYDAENRLIEQSGVMEGIGTKIKEENEIKNSDFREGLAQYQTGGYAQIRVGKREHFLQQEEETWIQLASYGTSSYIEQRIAKKGKKKEEYSLVVYGKMEEEGKGNDQGVILRMWYQDENGKVVGYEQRRYPKRNEAKEEVYTLSLRSAGAFQQIIVRVEVEQHAKIWLKHMNVYQKSSAMRREYGNQGVLIYEKRGKKEWISSYDQKRHIVGLLDHKSEGYTDEYDKRNRIIERKDLYGNRIKWSYNDENECIKEERRSGEEIIERRKEGYEPDSEHYQEYAFDALGEYTAYFYDHGRRRIEKIYERDGQNVSYQYNSYQAIEKVEENSNTSSLKRGQSIAYNEKRELKEAIGAKKESYQWGYNNDQEIESVAGNGKVIEAWEYEKEGEKRSGRLKKKQYGEKDRYIWSYNSEQQVEEIAYEEGEERAVKARYEYDAKERLIGVQSEGRERKYTYNSEDQVTRIEREDGSKERYLYNEEGEIIGREREKEEKHLELWGEENIFQGVSPKALYYQQYEEMHVGFYVEGMNEEGEKSGYSDCHLYQWKEGEYSSPKYEKNYSPEAYYEKEGIPCLVVQERDNAHNAKSGMLYQIPIQENNGEGYGFGGLYCPIWRNEEGAIFQLAYHDERNYRKVYQLYRREKNVALEVYDEAKNTIRTLKQWEEILTEDKWIFLAVHYQEEGEGGKWYVHINDQRYEVQSNHLEDLPPSQIQKMEYLVGTRGEQNYLLPGARGYYTGVFYQVGKMQEESIFAYYHELEKHILSLAHRRASETEKTRYSEQYEDIGKAIEDEAIEIVPLRGNARTLSGIEPTWRRKYEEDEEEAPSFVYEPKIRRMVYEGKRNELVYAVKGEGLYLSVNIKMEGKPSHFLTIESEEGNIHLQVEEEGTFSYQIGEEKRKTGIFIEEDRYYPVQLSIGSNVIRMRIDGENIEENLPFSMGEEKSIVIGNRQDGHRYAQLWYGKKSLTMEALEILEKKGKGRKEEIRIDGFGRIHTIDLYHEGKNILQRKKGYVKRRNQNQYTSTWESGESYVFPKTQYYISYGYDKVGRLLYAIKNGQEQRYTYDQRGYLIKETKSYKSREYSYDVGGNIVTIKDSQTGIKTFQYDEQYPHRLRQAGEEKISYEEKNPYLIKEIREGDKITKRFTWEGKRLVCLEKEKETIRYRYNDLGERIEKIIEREENGEKKEERIEYGYEEGKLLYETRGEEKLRYFYGGNGEIQAIERSKGEEKAVYYYLWDQRGIVGLINEEGEIVSQYQYEGYGEHTYKKEDIGRINPIRYRGYYYDEESGFYWVTTRYYEPKWGRWISPDSVDYLDPTAMQGLNLYCYCENDPINKYDPSGHAWEWSSFWQGVGYLVTGIGAIVAGALVIASGVATWPMLLVAGITIGAGALTTINGASEVVEAGTGYNFVEDTVFGGNSSAYNTYATITGSVATIGSLVCGGWYKYNTPRIQAYKNVGNYNFSGTLSDSTHLARPYQHSTLLQRNIIKYGKMVKESSGIYNFTIGGAYKIGWVSYGVGNVGSHPVTWKLVLDIGKQIILHAGF